MKVFPVILSGGVGSRLWPLSREHYPKQCLNLTSPDISLLQRTVMRAQGVDELMPPIVVCNEDHRFLIAQQLKGLGICNAQIILEPVGRNTAPAIALAALEASYDDDALLLVLPADHVINNLDEFNLAFNSALEIAKKDFIVTFGIKPTRAETGYGYIKAGEDNKVLEFVEKKRKRK